MGGRGSRTRRLSGLAGALVLCAAWACNKEDVAPQMHPPGGGWDGPVQEDPEPPPDGERGRRDLPPGSTAGDPGHEEPPPDTGDEILPPPSGADIPLGAPPLPDGIEGVLLSGTVEYSGYKGGLIQIDISDQPMGGGPNRKVRPKIVRLYRLETPGPFEMDIPKGQGKIWISAYNDADKNGRPSRGEPRGSAEDNPYNVASEGITGVEIVLEKEEIPPPPP